MELKFENIKHLMKHHGYNASEEIQYEAFLSLLYFSSKNITPGQDIFATCLEGPPGAGKTFYAETYAKVVKDVYDTDVEFIEYQCDATTGKNELFEDINISAAIRHDADNVSIKGKLVRAIEEVNKGKKVILFIDEYDKAREETDAFLLQFLQSGKLNSNQFGDLGIKNEFKNNLQVILSKNDFREELSGPLSRRLRIVRLNYMHPTIFLEVAQQVLLNNNISEGLVNLVSLMYNEIYEKKDLFIRIPSCSEMLIAITDTDKLMKYANAPTHVIYNTLIKGIFKDKDDIESFENGITAQNQELKKLIDEMKSSKTTITEESITIMLSSTILKKEAEALNSENRRLNEELKNKLANLDKEYESKLKELEENKEMVISLMDEYEKKIKDLEGKVKKESPKLKIGDSSLELTTDDEKFISNFEEEKFVKRGKSIFSVSDKDFTNIVNVVISTKDTKNIITDAERRKLVLYENGLLLFKNPNINLVLARKQITQLGNETVKIFIDAVVTPIELIKKMLDYFSNYCDIEDHSINIDSIVYIREKFKKLFSTSNEIMPIGGYQNLYRLNYNNKQKNIGAILNNLNDKYLEEDIILSREASDKILTLR